MSIFAKQHSLISSPYSGADAILIDRICFMEDRMVRGVNTFHRCANINIPQALEEVLEAVMPSYTVQISWYGKNNVVLAGKEIFVTMSDAGNVLDLRMWGSKELTDELVATFEAKFSDAEVPVIKWYYRGSNGMSYSSIPLEGVRPVKDEYYPYIKGGVEDYVARFRNSDAAVLIMLGEPGTGKTSFIRNMIAKHKLNTMLTYDENVMQSDEFFINYLTDDDRSDLLVVEDADALLTSRENDGNKIMAKLLNVSDGLVKVVRKKVIFTTNITDINKIDDALTRPGRCFDLVRFRALEYKEAVEAARAAGVNQPEDRKDYTLAEIFNQQPKSATKERFGFC